MRHHPKVPTLAGVAALKAILEDAVRAFSKDAEASADDVNGSVRGQTREGARGRTLLFWYFENVADMKREALKYWQSHARDAWTLGVELSAWVWMRTDPLLRSAVLMDRQLERDNLMHNLEGNEIEGWLFQAAVTGIKTMKLVGHDVNPQEVLGLLRELIFEHGKRGIRRGADEDRAVDSSLGA